MDTHTPLCSLSASEHMLKFYRSSQHNGDTLLKKGFLYILRLLMSHNKRYVISTAGGKGNIFVPDEKVSTRTKSRCCLPVTPLLMYINFLFCW